MSWININSQDLCDNIEECLRTPVVLEYLKLFTDRQQYYMLKLCGQVGGEVKLKEIMDSRRGEKDHRIGNNKRINI